MSLATVAWRKRWRSTTTRKAVALLQLELSGGPVIRCATADLQDPDGGHWQNILLPDLVINSRTSLLSADVSLATCKFRLEDKRLGFQTAGQRLSSLMATYDFENAIVTVWFIEQANATADWPVMFYGKVQDVSTSMGSVDFSATLSADWNRRVQLRKVTRLAYPGASEDAIDAVLPVQLGRVRGLPMRLGSPSLDYTELHHIREHIAGGTLAAQAVLVDTGRGGGGANPKGRVVVAGHKVKQLGSSTPNYGTTTFLAGTDGSLHVMDVAPAEFFNNSTDGAGWTLPDGTSTAWAPLYVSDIDGSVTTAEEPRAILDRKNETTFARLDYTGLKRLLNARLQSIPSPGTMLNVYAYCIYRASGAGAEFRLRLGGGAQLVAMPASAATTYIFLNCGSAWGTSSLPSEPWDFSANSLEVGFPGVATGVTVEVVGMGLTVEYRPTQDVIEQRRQLEEIPLPIGLRDNPAGVGLLGPLIRSGKVEQLVNITEVRGKFLANVDGFPDDAAGRYAGDTITLTKCSVVSGNAVVQLSNATAPESVSKLELLAAADVVQGTSPFPGGTTVLSVDTVLLRVTMSNPANTTSTVATVNITRATRVVERPADLARLVLTEFGGLTDGDFELTPGELGCFTDGRALTRTWNERDMVLGLTLTEALDLSGVLSILSAASASQCVLDECTGKWRFMPWRINPPVTYHTPVSRNDLLDPDTGPETSSTPRSSVASGISVQYGLDPITRGYACTSSAEADGSVSGHYFRNLRDGLRTVTTGVNDKVDVYDATFGARTRTLAAGGPLTEAGVISALKVAFTGDSIAHAYGCGGTVVAGVNDHIRINDGAAKSAFLTAGTMTMEARAADAMAQLNTVSSGWSVGYNRTTRKFTFGRSSGTASLLWNTGASNSACSVFGFAFIDLVGTSFYIGPGECEEGLVSIATDREWNLTWRSGTNGQQGTKISAWQVLGFDWSTDSIGVGKGTPGRRHVGASPLCSVEELLAAADAKNGRKRPIAVDGRAIYDSSTARELRNRLVAIMGKRRTFVRFPSDTLSDLRRGDVFEFSSDMDSLKPYPALGAGGSWANRKLVVLELEKHAGLSWHTEVVCVDMTD